MKTFNYKFGEWLLDKKIDEIKEAWNKFCNKQKASIRFCISNFDISPIEGRQFKMTSSDKGDFETYVNRKLSKAFEKHYFLFKFNDFSNIEKCADKWHKHVKEEKRKKDKAIAERKAILKNVGAFMSGLRLGANAEPAEASYSDENLIYVGSYDDKYSNSCKFKKIVRYVRVYIKRGYSLHDVGGLYTIVRGNKIIRKGMACEWVEQGREMTDTKMKKGYLVRGEHIEAKTLKQALKISEEHRAKTLEKALSNRQFKAVQRERLQSVMVSINDSIEGGNCMPGTLSFKHRIEEELGEEINELSAEQVLYYGKKFGLLLYAERAVKVALNKK